MDEEFVARCKEINWQKIINVCDSLNDLNDRQLRFLKGRVIELLVENESNGFLTYVNEKHKDFECPSFKYTVELKSLTSEQLYKKNGELKKNNTVMLNNSMGTNKKLVLDPSEVCDYLFVVKSDGAVLVDKQTVIKNAKSNGDGFRIHLEPDHVIELSGRLLVNCKYDLDIRDKMDTLLRNTIKSLEDKNVQKN